MDNQEHIVKGFNAGYRLEQHKPELARQLLNGFVDKEHPYAQGFQAGIKEYAKERFKAKMRARDQNKSKNNDLDYSR